MLYTFRHIQLVIIVGFVSSLKSKSACESAQIVSMYNINMIILSSYWHHNSRHALKHIKVNLLATTMLDGFKKSWTKFVEQFVLTTDTYLACTTVRLMLQCIHLFVQRQFLDNSSLENTRIRIMLRVCWGAVLSSCSNWRRDGSSSSNGSHRIGEVLASAQSRDWLQSTTSRQRWVELKWLTEGCSVWGSTFHVLAMLWITVTAIRHIKTYFQSPTH